MLIAMCDRCLNAREKACDAAKVFIASRDRVAQLTMVGRVTVVDIIQLRTADVQMVTAMNAAEQQIGHCKCRMAAAVIDCGPKCGDHVWDQV